MAPTPEATLVNKIKERLRSEYDILIFKYHGSMYSQTGFPDLFGVWNGRFVAFEVKVPGKKPSAAQLAMLEYLAEHGALCAWVTSVDEIDFWINEWR